MEVASLYATLRLDDAQYKQGIQGAKTQINEAKSSVDDMQKSSNSLATALKGVGAAIVAAFSVDTIRRGAAAIVNVTSQMEQYRIRLRSVIEEQREADATFQRIKDWAALNPVNTDEAIASFVLLKAAAVDNTEDAVKAVGNLAAVMGRDMRDVSTGLISLNTLQLRRLGIIIDQTGSKASISIGKTRVEVEKDVHLMRKALIELIEQKYGGAMENAKDTFKGISDTIGGQVQNFLTDLGGMEDGSPFRGLTKDLTALSDAFQEWQQSEGYKKAIWSFHQIANGAITAAKEIGGLAVTVISSDIGSTILSWGIGIKASSLAIAGLTKASYALALGLGSVATAWKAGAVAGAHATGIISGLSRAYTLASTAMATGSGVMASLKYGMTGLAGVISPGSGIVLGLAALATGAYKAWRAFKDLNDERERMKVEIAQKWEDLYNQILSDADARREADRLKKEISHEAAFQRELERAKTPGHSIFLASTRIFAAAQREFEQAKTLSERYGLDISKTYEDIASNIRDGNKELLEEVVKVAGGGGLAAVNKQLADMAGATPELKPIIDAFAGVETKVKSAKEQIKELADEMGGLTGPINKVTKALKDGLMPEGAFGEAVRYVQDNWKSVTGKLKESLSLEFSGQSKDFLLGIQRSEERGIAESLGFAPARGTAPAPRATTDRMALELSDSTIAKLRPPQATRTTMPVQVNVYQTGFQVKDEAGARRMGRLSGEGVRLGLAGAAQ